MEWMRNEGSLSVEFDAEDPVKRAAFDAEARARQPRPLPEKKTDGVGCVLGCATLFGILVGGCLANIDGHFRLQAAGVVIVVTTLALSGPIHSRRQARAAQAPMLPEVIVPPVPDATSRFILTITPSALTLSVDGRAVRDVPLADIADVVVAKRVELVRGDGSRTDLPITLHPFVNGDMADDIRTGIREMRALQSDYRGEPTTRT